MKQDELGPTNSPFCFYTSPTSLFFSFFFSSSLFFLLPSFNHDIHPHTNKHHALTAGWQFDKRGSVLYFLSLSLFLVLCTHVHTSVFSSPLLCVPFHVVSSCSSRTLLFCECVYNFSICSVRLIYTLALLFFGLPPSSSSSSSSVPSLLPFPL